MTTTSADDRLDRLLSELDPGRSLPTPTVASALRELSRRLESAELRDEVGALLDTPRSRRKSRRIGWGVAGLLVVLFGVFGAIPAASAISLWLAHTHTFGANFAPTKTQATADSESDTSEWLGLDAPDVNRALAQLYPGYLTLPSGISRDDAIRTIIRLNKASVSTAGGHVEGQVTLVKETYEAFANCAWYGDWLTADTAQDSARLQVDNAGLATAAKFPATAGQSPTIIPYLTRWAAGAATGNRTDVEKGYQASACSEFMTGLNP